MRTLRIGNSRSTLSRPVVSAFWSTANSILTARPETAGHNVDLLKPSEVWSRDEVLRRPSAVPRSDGICAWCFREIPSSVQPEATFDDRELTAPRFRVCGRPRDWLLEVCPLMPNLAMSPDASFMTSISPTSHWHVTQLTWRHAIGGDRWADGDTAENGHPQIPLRMRPILPIDYHGRPLSRSVLRASLRSIGGYLRGFLTRSPPWTETSSNP